MPALSIARQSAGSGTYPLNCPGKEVVQVYLRDVVATITPPGKRLVRFGKIDLEPGAAQNLTFTLNREDLSFTGINNKPTVEPGDFLVMVGNLQQRFTVTE